MLHTQWATVVYRYKTPLPRGPAFLLPRLIPKKSLILFGTFQIKVICLFGRLKTISLWWQVKGQPEELRYQMHHFAFLLRALSLKCHCSLPQIPLMFCEVQKRHNRIHRKNPSPTLWAIVPGYYWSSASISVTKIVFWLRLIQYKQVSLHSQRTTRDAESSLALIAFQG